MRKNGFTLIEVLAVIVILAIIALIATPIILGIINDAREKANERSVELYASAVRNAVVAYQLAELNSPESFSDLNIQYEGNVECTIEELYSDGSFYLDGCKVNKSEKEYSYGIEEETPDKFYVIEDAELTATTIQMLTEKHIHTTEYRQSDSAGSVAFSTTIYWASEEIDTMGNTVYVLLSQYGTEDSAYIYDENNDLIKPIVDEYVNYLNTKLTGATGNLLTYSQVENIGDSNSNPVTPSWIVSPGYYWTGSLYDSSYSYPSIWLAYDDTSLFYANSYDTIYHVRPVITISTDDLK